LCVRRFCDLEHHRKTQEHQGLSNHLHSNLPVPRQRKSLVASILPQDVRSKSPSRKTLSFLEPDSLSDAVSWTSARRECYRQAVSYWLTNISARLRLGSPSKARFSRLGWESTNPNSSDNDRSVNPINAPSSVPASPDIAPLPA
jgi:hypothetical protein